MSEAFLVGKFIMKVILTFLEAFVMCNNFICLIF